MNVTQVKIWDDDTMSDDFLGEREVDLDMQVCLRIDLYLVIPDLRYK